ncbi:hypothetical protein [Kitasatospora sp. NBC_01539]|uniref:hypothetical protein n=1 Tax=Kitasatospora sp. NBC_01539 TaxID=2903577 RepID=UPI00386024D6
MPDDPRQSLARLLADPAARPGLAAAWNALRAAVHDLASGPTGPAEPATAAAVVDALRLLADVDGRALALRAPAPAPVPAAVAAPDSVPDPAPVPAVAPAAAPVPVPPSPAVAAVAGSRQPGKAGRTVPWEQYGDLVAAGAEQPDAAVEELLAGRRPGLLRAVGGLLALARHAEGLGRIDPAGPGPGPVSRFDPGADLPAYRRDVLTAAAAVGEAATDDDRVLALNLLDRRLRELVPVTADGHGRLLVVGPGPCPAWTELLDGGFAEQSAAAEGTGRLHVGIPAPGSSYTAVRDRGLLAAEHCVVQPPRPPDSAEHVVIWAYRAWVTVDDTRGGVRTPLARARVVYTQAPD